MNSVGKDSNILFLTLPLATLRAEELQTSTGICLSSGPYHLVIVHPASVIFSPVSSNLDTRALHLRRQGRRRCTRQRSNPTPSTPSFPTPRGPYSNGPHWRLVNAVPPRRSSRSRRSFCSPSSACGACWASSVAFQCFLRLPLRPRPHLRHPPRPLRFPFQEK